MDCEDPPWPSPSLGSLGGASAGPGTPACNLGCLGQQVALSDQMLP